MNVENGCVVSLQFKLSSTMGEVLDQSSPDTPLVYLHGGEGILPVLEEQLGGKTAGEAFSITVTPEQGYGQREEQLVRRVPKEQIPQHSQLAVGTPIELTVQENEEPLGAFVTEIDDNFVTIDANHPLAGVTIIFEGTIEDVRKATEAEVAAGHPEG